MRTLDRPGIFKAIPLDWKVRQSERSSAVSVSIEFRIEAELDGSDWHDWTQYEDHTIWGDFWVVKGDGTVNAKTVEMLATCLGWDGDIQKVATRRAPNVLVQIRVEEEEFNGRSRLRVQWMNPGDYSPRPEGLSGEEAGKIAAQFGSLLRAAAGAAAKAAKPVPAPSSRSSGGSNPASAGTAPASAGAPPEDDGWAPHTGPQGEPLTIEDTPF